MIEKHVIVTTAHRGVFYGRLVEDTGENVTLEDARNVLVWSKATRGFLGLAQRGPQEGSRVGPKVPRLVIRGVTAMALCTPEAVQQWESEPWS